MILYFNADLWRINRRIPRIAAFVLYLLVGAATIVASSAQKSFNFIKLGDAMANTFMFLPILLAMVNFYFVFEDDFQVKTMQAAIGRGVKRWQIILVKWCEMFVLSFLDCMMLLLVMCGVGLCKGITLKGSAVFHVAAQACGTMLTIGVMTALMMIIIFQILQLGLTQLLFLIFALKPVSLIITYQETANEVMAKLQLSRFLIGSSLNAWEQSMETGQFQLQNFVVILIYWGIGIGASYVVFRKKELDF